MKEILFVCTGNTCRSPMCTALFNWKYSSGAARHAFSAGLFADGSPISRNASAALADFGVPELGDDNYSDHVSHTVTEEDISKADEVYGVTSAHAAHLRRLFPAYSEKIKVLPLPVSDPFGSDLNRYKQCLEDIDASLAILFSD